jgi:acetyl esterase/lipase
VLETSRETIGVERMTIGGESAGGHLAAATILRLRDAGIPFDRVKGATLTYGCYDLGGTEMRSRAGPRTLVLHGPTLPRILDMARGIPDRAVWRLTMKTLLAPGGIFAARADQD